MKLCLGIEMNNKFKGVITADTRKELVHKFIILNRKYGNHLIPIGIVFHKPEGRGGYFAEKRLTNKECEDAKKQMEKMD